MFMILVMKTLVLVVVLFLSFEVELKCQTELDQKDRRWMSTKTGYRQIANHLPKAEPLDLEECSAVHLWTVVRHGTRYPSKKAIKLMMEDLPELRDKIINAENNLCPEDLELLRNWSISVEKNVSKNLHAEGENEMILLGERWLQRLPKLLDHYEESEYRIRSTDTERSIKSGKSFITGLWTRVLVPRVKMHVVTSGHDPLVRFYKLCDGWIHGVKKNVTANIHRDKFEQSEVMQSVATSMSVLLGINVTVDDLDMMYVMCNFDLAWSPTKISPWCRLFSDHDLQVMEYREDLEYFWIDGPGHDLNGDQACVLVKDMLDTFRDIAWGNNTQNGTFYFAHSGTILKLLAYLSVFDDVVEMKSDNFDQMNQRKWRTSEIGPFGSNIAFVLQKCDNKDFKIGLFINERLTRILGCEEDWCPLKNFIDLYPEIDNCDFDKICKISDFKERVDVPDDKY